MTIEIIWNEAIYMKYEDWYEWCINTNACVKPPEDKGLQVWSALVTKDIADSHKILRNVFIKTLW